MCQPCGLHRSRRVVLEQRALCCRSHVIGPLEVSVRVRGRQLTIYGIGTQQAARRVTCLDGVAVEEVVLRTSGNVTLSEQIVLRRVLPLHVAKHGLTLLSVDVPSYVSSEQLPLFPL